MTKLIPSLPFALLAGVFFFGSTVSVSAQKQFDQLPAAERRLTAVTAKGSQRYAQDAIAAASGLQLGSTVTEDDFKKAARRLGDMGVFTDVGYSYSYTSTGTKLELQLTDAEKFVPVRFEDFVWFPESEMLRRIKEHAPLFEGELPLSGRLTEEVSDVLQAMLVENAIPGHVEYVRFGKNDEPVEAIIFKVSDVVISVRNIEFTGAGEDELPALKAAAHRLMDREYSRTLLNSLVEKQLLPVYYSRGYLKASFGPPEPKVVKQPSDPGDEGVKHMTIVEVTFAVKPGSQYKLKAVEWSGNQAVPTDVLAKMIRAQPGEPANSVRIHDNLRDIQKLYGSKGYVTAAFTADVDFDDPAGTVVMRLGVKEGFQYHMGELEFRGLDNSLTAKLRNEWKIRPGEVYDASYLEEYLPAAHKLLPANLDWDVSSHVTANVRDKSVDVDLIYSVKAPK
jgi:outer membrane protein insertion porin family